MYAYGANTDGVLTDGAFTDGGFTGGALIWDYIGRGLYLYMLASCVLALACMPT